MIDEDKKIYEFCGFEYLPKGSHDKFHRLNAIRYPDGCIYSVEPPLDLNFYFKYAVPKLIPTKEVLVSHEPDKQWRVVLWGMKDKDSTDIEVLNQDPAEAFGQALLLLIKGE